MPAKKPDYSKQHAAIMGALRTSPHTTLQILRACGVLSVSARIHELRAMGENIDTHLVTVRNRYGQHCHVAQYVLRPKRRRMAKPAARRRA
jgi:hypothetical protein